MGMTATQWGETIAKSGFLLFPKETIRHATVLLAERFFSDSAYEYHGPVKDVIWNGPHWQVIWGIERNGFDVAGKVYCPRLFTRSERLADGRKAAAIWIGDNLKVGRYKA